MKHSMHKQYFCIPWVHQVVEEVVTVEFEPESSSQVIVRMNNEAHYHLDLDWNLSPEEFVDRLMDQVDRDICGRSI
jgi:hypothetical protein